MWMIPRTNGLLILVHSMIILKVNFLEHIESELLEQMLETELVIFPGEYCSESF
jgi:hypothetical protein